MSWVPSRRTWARTFAASAAPGLRGCQDAGLRAEGQLVTAEGFVEAGTDGEYLPDLVADSRATSAGIAQQEMTSSGTRAAETAHRDAQAR